MKKISILVLMLFINTSIHAQKKQIILSQEGNQLVNIKKSNLSFTSKATTNKLSFTNVRTQKGDFVNLDAEGLYKIYIKGVPNLPVYSKLIEVPQDAKVSIKIISFDEEIVDLNAKGITGKITPAQPSARKSGRNNKFYMDKKLYHKDAFFSLGDKVIYEESGQMRATRLGRIEIRPFAYNPVKNLLKVYKNIKFQVNFEGADLNKTFDIKRKYGGINSTPANLFFKLNQDNKSFLSQMPFTYVIVADRAYQSALQPFVQWKTKKGFKVIEAYTDDPNVGNTVASIKAYCQNLYQIPPVGVNPLSFILVVGDINVIPATQHTEVDSNPYTDLDIAEYTGDYLPEVNFGRWSVDNEQQVTDIVDKTIKYEKLQMSDINYLGQSLLVAGDDEGHEDTYGGGAIYYADHYYANATNHIHSHTFLQNTIETWGGNSQGNQRAHDSIITNINTGVGLANYTAHCSPAGWSEPEFSQSDLNNNIHNDEKYGLWIGNCCQSNKFDENESFAELAIRKPNAGVIGYIGGSQFTYWDEDYYWGVGVGNIVAQPDYNNTTAGCYDTYFHTEANEVNDPSKWYITNYQIAQAGNLAVEASTSTRKPYYWVIYQLAGDPSVIPYIGLPQPMAVNTSPSGLIIGASSLTVNATPYAYVALSQNGVLVATGSTDVSGSVNLQFDPSLLSVGNADLVVTAQNKVPYINTVVVAPANTPYVSLDNYTTSAVANYNSTIQLNVNLKNVAAVGSGYDAINVNTILSTTDQYITINDNNEDYGNIPAGGNELKNSVFDISIADNVPDQHVAHFNIEITGEDISGTQYTWNSTFTMTINAPDISIGNLSITNDANANGLIDPGETGDLNFTVSNTGHADANFNGELSLTNNPNAYYALGTTIVSQINIPAGSSHDFVFTGASVDASAPLGTEIELSLTVNAGDNNQYTMQSVQNTTTGLIPIYNISTQGTLSVCTGTFYDSGLDTGNYSNDEDYTMTFMPPAQGSVTVNFTSFNIEDGYDFLHVYDGPDTNSPEIQGSPFTGTVSPGTLTSTNGLTFHFESDYSINKAGWVAEVSCGTSSVNSYTENLNIYPNPTNGLFTINTGSMKNSILNIYSISGKLIYQKQINSNKTNVDLRNQAKGLYVVKVVSDNKLYVSKLIMK